MLRKNVIWFIIFRNLLSIIVLRNSIKMISTKWAKNMRGKKLIFHSHQVKNQVLHLSLILQFLIADLQNVATLKILEIMKVVVVKKYANRDLILKMESKSLNNDLNLHTMFI